MRRLVFFVLYVKGEATRCTGDADVGGTADDDDAGGAAAAAAMSMDVFHTVLSMAMLAGFCAHHRMSLASCLGVRMDWISCISSTRHLFFRVTRSRKPFI